MSRQITDELLTPTLRERGQTQREVLEVDAAHWSDIFSNSSYTIPDYQRNYSWGKEQQTDFLDTVINAFDDVKRFPDEDDYELSSPAGAYLGTVYFAEDADKSGSHQTTYEVVDGQQRVTTVQIMLSVLYDYIQYYHDGEGADDCSPGTFQDLTTAKEHLSDAFNRDGNPSVELSENENDYVKALAAKAERGRRDPARIEFIKNRLEINSDITGKHHPRAIQIKTLLEIFDDFQRYKPGKVSLEEQLVEELDKPDEEDEEDESTKESEDEEEADPEFSRRNEWIRFERSHERLVEMYKRVYKRIDSETSDLNADQSAYYLSNLSEFLLNAMTVSRCTIEVPDSNLHMDIFKSINDKGQPLHGIDLIRARIRHSLAGASSNTVISDLNKMLTKFGGDKDKFRKMLEYYIAVDEDSLSTVSNASDELMNYFSRRNSNTSVEPRLSGGEDQIESRINDILDYAEYYYSMFDGDGDRFDALDNSISTTDKQDLRTILSRLEDSIGATQYRSLGAYACWRVGTESRIEEEAAGEFLKDVFNGSEVLTLRQSISDKSGQAIEGVYVKTAHRLKSRLNELEEGEATVEDAFKGANVVDDIRTVAEDKEGSFFENGMVRAVIANTGWRNRQVRAVFHRMTQRLLREGDVELELRNVDELDIEHILPQKPISNNNGRSRSNGAVSKYAWLEYFFDTSNSDNKITNAVEELIDKDIDDLDKNEIEELELDDQRKENDLQEAIGQIKNRFIDDIANRLFLHNIDDKKLQNKLFSYKLPVYLKDDYTSLATNNFVSADDGFNLFDHIKNIESDDLNEENIDDLSDSEWEAIDRAWTFEMLFERKKSIVPEILKTISFSTNPDEFTSDQIEVTIGEELDKDKQYRLDQSSF